MLPAIPNAWSDLLLPETQKPSFQALDAFLDGEVAAGHTVLPARADIFTALQLTPPDSVKVLLLGQDPYPTPGHAHGLCFSVQPDVRPLPMSLRNVYRELHDDVGFRVPNSGHLAPWARQGVLMLNTVLTVRARSANSHARRGWETFTDRIIELVAARSSRVVFLLWGGAARRKAILVPQPHHVIIECAHPSPLSARKFLGCRCFSRTNQKLVEAGLAPVDWAIPDV
ncbi:MAG TPA: uracil-DNA glycosylase [Polyangia bacterium]